MERLINKVKLFSNHTPSSNEIEEKLTKLLQQYHFEIVEEGYDLMIAIGGDGCFLKMVKATNFNSDVYYIGINTGTLGFAQEIRAEECEEFVEKLNRNGYKIDLVGIQETKINYGNSTAHFYSINEIVIRDSELNVTNLDIKINDVELEYYVGDGLLISTSFGSTAYNLSFGGSIVFDDLHTLQITPIAPLNTKSYRNLLNSLVIPENRIITIIPRPNKSNLIITVDGENSFYDHVAMIETFVKDKRLKLLREKDYDFSKKVNEKFLK